MPFVSCQAKEAPATDPKNYRPPCMRMTSEQAGEALDRALAESRQRRAKDLASRIIASRNSRESGYILLEL